MDNRQPKARTSTMLRYSGAGAANTQLGVFATVSADKNKYEAHVASSIPVPPPSDGVKALYPPAALPLPAALQLAMAHPRNLGMIQMPPSQYRFMLLPYAPLWAALLPFRLHSWPSIGLSFTPSRRP
eukprot:1140613-Pelagomonas_calceolata.AAC.1